MQVSWKKYTLNFKQPAGTSRGTLRTKDSYFLILKEGDRLGIGECGILRGLSADDRPDYEAQLNWLVQNIHLPEAELFGELLEFPSIQFGLEMALRDLQSEDHILFPSEFTAGKASQSINGLIWMGDKDFMQKQVKDKLQQGFRVLKMKIGAIDIKEELAILKSIRQEFGKSDLELRVDANGAFELKQATEVLKELSELDIHSIEQPIKPMQWEAMAQLCQATPVPIALDEDLIGLFTVAERRKLLSTVRPQYVILKPSFVGGWRGSEEWIELASESNIGWWVTSALESNVGLNAIAQWNYLQDNSMPSGLGTGSLYTNNFESPLYIEKGAIAYDRGARWGLSGLV